MKAITIHDQQLIDQALNHFITPDKLESFAEKAQTFSCKALLLSAAKIQRAYGRKQVLEFLSPPIYPRLSA